MICVRIALSPPDIGKSASPSPSHVVTENPSDAEAQFIKLHFAPTFSFKIGIIAGYFLSFFCNLYQRHQKIHKDQYIEMVLVQAFHRLRLKSN